MLEMAEADFVSATQILTRRWCQVVPEMPGELCPNSSEGDVSEGMRYLKPHCDPGRSWVYRITTPRIGQYSRTEGLAGVLDVCPACLGR